MEAAGGSESEGEEVKRRDERISEAKRLYSVSKIEQAFKYFKAISSKGGDSEALTGIDDSTLEKAKADLVHEIRRKHEKMTETRALVLNKKGWETVVDNHDGISTFHRQEPDTPVHSIKVVGLIDAPIQHMLSLIIEADLIPTFIDYVKLEVRQLVIKSVYHQLLYQKVYLPWPLDNRDVVVEAQGFDLLDEHGEIIVYGQSVDSFADVPIPPVQGRLMRLQIHLAGARIRPLTMTKVELTGVVNVDFKVFLPTWAVNWLARNLAYYAFVQFREKASSTKGNGPHHQRVVEKKDLYAQVMRPVVKYFLDQHKLEEIKTHPKSQIHPQAESKPPEMLPDEAVEITIELSTEMNTSVFGEAVEIEQMSKTESKGAESSRPPVVPGDDERAGVPPLKLNGQMLSPDFVVSPSRTRITI